MHWHVILVACKTIDTPMLAQPLAASSLPTSSHSVILALPNGLHTAKLLRQKLSLTHPHVTILSSVVTFPVCTLGCTPFCHSVTGWLRCGTPNSTTTTSSSTTTTPATRQSSGNQYPHPNRRRTGGRLKRNPYGAQLQYPHTQVIASQVHQALGQFTHVNPLYSLVRDSVFRSPCVNQATGACGPRPCVKGRPSCRRQYKQPNGNRMRTIDIWRTVLIRGT